MNRKRLIFLGCIAAVVIATAAMVILAVTIGQPKRKFVSSYYDGTRMYACRKPLEAEYKSIPSSRGSSYGGYVPVSQADTKLYCYPTK